MASLGSLLMCALLSGPVVLCTSAFAEPPEGPHGEFQFQVGAAGLAGGTIQNGTTAIAGGGQVNFDAVYQHPSYGDFRLHADLGYLGNLVGAAEFKPLVFVPQLLPKGFGIQGDVDLFQFTPQSIRNSVGLGLGASTFRPTQFGDEISSRSSAWFGVVSTAGYYQDRTNSVNQPTDPTTGATPAPASAAGYMAGGKTFAGFTEGPLTTEVSAEFDALFGLTRPYVLEDVVTPGNPKANPPTATVLQTELAAPGLTSGSGTILSLGANLGYAFNFFGQPLSFDLSGKLEDVQYSAKTQRPVGYSGTDGSPAPTSSNGQALVQGAAVSQNLGSVTLSAGISGKFQ